MTTGDGVFIPPEKACVVVLRSMEVPSHTHKLILMNALKVSRCWLSHARRLLLYLSRYILLLYTILLLYLYIKILLCSW